MKNTLTAAENEAIDLINAAIDDEGGNPDLGDLFCYQVPTLMDAVQRLSKRPSSDLESYYAKQVEWSRNTFGPALRTKGIIDHITKELREIDAEPTDLSEWVDVMILAMDGFWRHGGKPEELMARLQAKQDKNFARTWPDWRTMSEDKAIEHDRSGETPAPIPDPDAALTAATCPNNIAGCFCKPSPGFSCERAERASQ